MADNSKVSREQAGSRFERAQAASRDAEKAKAQYEAEGRAMREKTARLKSLRLAKEAADTAAGVDKEPVAPAKKPVASAKKSAS